MVKKQFIINYVGNKRDETQKYINYYPKIDNFKYIIEPFCGSFGFSRKL